MGAVLAPMASDGKTIFVTRLDFAVLMVTAGGMNGGADYLRIPFHDRGFTARANLLIIVVDILKIFSS